MRQSTPEQRQIIHAILYKKGLLKHKADIIDGATNGRSESSKDLTYDEAQQLIDSLNDYESEMNVSSKLMSKLFAMAFEMNWVPETTVWNDQKKTLAKKKDYKAVHSWVEKYGYLKKKLREYTYKELPKLVSQFETGPYKDYIVKLSNK